MGEIDRDAGPVTERSRPAPDAVRRRLALALDLDDLVEAHRWAATLRPWFGVAKIGLELFSAAGPDAIGAMRDLGYQVFLDLKLFDIPTTVQRSTRVLGALGVDYLTLHARGGVDMLRAGVDGLLEGAEGAGLPAPTPLAVTVLTSDDDAPAHIVPNRVRVAVEGGCGGLVLAAEDLQTARELAPRLKRVVPGIRLRGGDRHDQARSATPQEAAAQRCRPAGHRSRRDRCAGPPSGGGGDRLGRLAAASTLDVDWADGGAIACGRAAPRRARRRPVSASLRGLRSLRRARSSSHGRGGTAAGACSRRCREPARSTRDAASPSWGSMRGGGSASSRCRRTCAIRGGSSVVRAAGADR